MPDIVVLRGVPTELASTDGHAFVVDCTRPGEGVISDRDVRDRYEIDDASWETIAKNPALARAIRTCSEQRVRSGLAARELAQQHFVKAPGILNGIMTNENSNPRHKIEAIKELRATAVGTGNNEHPAAGTVFQITIDLGGGHVETYEKVIEPVKTIEAPTNEVARDTWGWDEK